MTHIKPINDSHSSLILLLETLEHNINKYSEKSIDGIDKVKSERVK